MKMVVVLVGMVFLAQLRVCGDIWEDMKNKSSAMKESWDSKMDEILGPSTDDTAKLIKKIEKFAPDYIQTRQAQHKAPAKKLIGKDKAYYAEKAQEQLQEIQDLLFDQDMLGQSAKIKKIETKISSIKAEASFTNSPVSARCGWRLLPPRRASAVRAGLPPRAYGLPSGRLVGSSR